MSQECSVFIYDHIHVVGRAKSHSFLLRKSLEGLGLTDVLYIIWLNPGDLGFKVQEG